MLLYNKEKVRVGLLENCKDYKIESVLSTGDKTLSFSYPKIKSGLIEKEGYIRTKEDEYVIKQKDARGQYYSIKAQLNVEDIEGQTFEQFETINQTIDKCLELALTGTGWRVRINGNLSKRRTVRKSFCSSWEVLQEAKKVYKYEYKFDTINKILEIYETRGEYRGAYLIEGVNLKELSIQSNTYDYYTKLIAIGKTDEEGNQLKVEVENYQYSNKVKKYIWKDERYTDLETLEEDARLKLDEMSKPYIAYSATVIDLAASNDIYKNILDYSLGDLVDLISKDNRVKDRLRIVKLVQYPNNPEKNTCELANTTLTFEEKQREQQEVNDTVNNITSDNGTVSESAIKDVVEKITVKKVNVDELLAAEARIGELIATKVDITEAEIKFAEIEDLKAENVTINDTLKALHGKFETIEGQVGEFETVLAGKAEIGTVTALDAKIKQLASEVITTDYLEAELIKAQEATITKIDTEYLTAIKAEIKELSGISAEFEIVKTEFAEIKELVAGSVTVDTINGMLANFDKIIAGEIVSDKFTSANAVIKKLQSDLIKTNELVATKVTADEVKAQFANFDKIVAGQIVSTEFQGILGRFETIEVTTGTFEEIFADKIVTDELGAKKINASFLEAGSITAESGILASGVIGELELAQGAVKSLHIGKGQINEAHINSLTVLDAFIKSLKADKIQGGTLDFNNIIVKNLRADSIIAGALTIEGDNLLHNSAMKNPLTLPNTVSNLKEWIKGTDNIVEIIQGTTTNFQGYNYLKYLTSGKADTYYSSVALSRVPMRPGEKFVFSFYALVNGSETLSNNFAIALDGYDSEEVAISGVTSTAILIKSWTNSTITKGTWTRYIVDFEVPNTTAWANVTYGNVRPRLQGNGAIRIAKPMLSRGSIASIFKEHTDELITDGAIGNNHLGEGSVSTSKLQLDELFTNEAFAVKLRTIELHADQIKTGKISSEFLDIEGIVNFKSFSDDVKEMFIFPTDGDQTYIDGGRIYTNSINAESINAKGLKVNDPSGKTTFHIDSDGEVFVTGNIESAGFDPNKQQGYRIEKNGNIIMNNAVVRGDVLLPNAGITNFGGIAENPNLLKESYPNITTASYLVRSFYFGDRKPVAGKTYTISLKGKLGEGKTSFGIYNSGGSIQVATLTPSTQGANGVYKTTFVWKVTSGSTTVANTHICVYAIASSVTSESTIEWIKLEEGSETSDKWTPAPEDNLNPVRFWAGTNYENRDSAPFKVLQDGTVIATKGIFDGTWTGSVQVGNIRIEDTNSSSAKFEIWTNNDTAKKVSLTDDISNFNQPVTFGAESSPYFRLDPSSKIAEINKGKLIIQGDKYNFMIDGASTGNLMNFNYRGGNGDYNTVFKYSSGTFIFSQEGDLAANAPEFIFQKNNGGSPAKTKFIGDIEVTEEVKVGDVRIVKKMDSGNEGIDFVI